MTEQSRLTKDSMVWSGTVNNETTYAHDHKHMIISIATEQLYIKKTCRLLRVFSESFIAYLRNCFLASGGSLSITSCFIKNFAEFFLTLFSSHLVFIPYLCLNQTVKVKRLGPLFVLGGWARS